MATTSTPEQNDPLLDNRDEYEVPPCALEFDPELNIDSDGFEVLVEIPEVIESDDSVAP